MNCICFILWRRWTSGIQLSRNGWLILNRYVSDRNTQRNQPECENYASRKKKSFKLKFKNQNVDVPTNDLLAPSLNNEVNDVTLCLYQYLKEETNYRLAWISTDYFESLLLPRGENDSKQSDDIKANCHRKFFLFVKKTLTLVGTSLSQWDGGIYG